MKIGLTEEEINKYNARVIPKNSVIMTCVGTFGLICINTKICVINQQLHAFVNNPFILSKYLAFALKYQVLWMIKNATSTTVSYLNKTNSNSVPIPVCSIKEQNQIVEEIETRFTMCDSLETSIEESLQKAEALRQSILKQAFEGKLVQQNPEDEPAEKLLERIKAQVKEVKIKKTTKKKR